MTDRSNLSRRWVALFPLRYKSFAFGNLRDSSTKFCGSEFAPSWIPIEQDLTVHQSEKSRTRMH